MPRPEESETIHLCYWGDEETGDCLRQIAGADPATVRQFRIAKCVGCGRRRNCAEIHIGMVEPGVYESLVARRHAERYAERRLRGR